MAQPITGVVLAGGLASRFGGSVKGLAAVGPKGECECLGGGWVRRLVLIFVLRSDVGDLAGPAQGVRRS
jgi:CTP:molybdopterin cytidylyltransferase MocA